MENKCLKTLLDAFLHSLLTLLKFIFLTPLKLWFKSAERLAEQKEQGSLDLSNINGLWPFMSYLKRLLIDFLFDAMSLLMYPLGIIFSIYGFIDSIITGIQYTTFGDGLVDGMSTFIATLVAFYFAPIVWAIYKDLFVLVLLPFRKFIDWCKKPAQYLQLDNNQK